MTKRTWRRDLNCTSAVRKARAGLIPASDAILHEAQARLRDAERVVGAARKHLGSAALASNDYVITDILTDLRHYCDHNSLAFDQLSATAEAFYLENKQSEAEAGVR